VGVDTTFRIATDSTGAPQFPAQLVPAGGTYVITPHGGNFERPVEVSIPVPNVSLLNTQQFKLAKADPNGEWQILDDSRVVDGKLKASVRSFSFFSGVIVSYVLPIAQAQPYTRTISFDCGAQNCNALVGPATVTMTVVGTGTQLQEPCVEGRLEVFRRETGIPGSPTETLTMPLAGGSITRTIPPPSGRLYPFFVSLMCNRAAGSPDFDFMGYLRNDVIWEGLPTQYPSLSMRGMPAQVDVVEGTQASVEATLAGGALQSHPRITPTATDHATVDWLRSIDEGRSWRTVARSFQHEANTLPFGTGEEWAPWSVSHQFIATSADQGALMRVNACYTPPAPTAPPPCVASAATRINVVQHSALPAIVDPPRSILIRTAETASFSATASGIPAPTLQWQTRPANSTGEWTDVGEGTGATSTNYTTSARMPSHNGQQYRMVATNALGTAASASVILSVSDIDVAPTITTQPASISVVNGNDAVFAVVAHGTEALSFQWRFNGANIAGANSPVLRLSGVTGANAGSYSIAVSNTAGNATSHAAALTVTDGIPAAIAPGIVTQPSDVSVNAGNTATFAVGVAGTGPFTFQWLRDGVPMSGATTAVLTFDSVAMPNAGAYSVRVTNSAGQVVSDSALLDVISTDVPVAPTITSQPATLILPIDGSGTIAVGATGTGPLAYQWYLNGSALPGATDPVLHFAHVGDVDFGTYTVTVSNGQGSVTSPAAQLILLGAPAITQQPAAVTALEGEHATFFVQASGSGLRYQWSVNGTPIPGAVAATFNTPPLVAANSGAVYSVMVYNGAGLVMSQGAVLTVQTVVAPTVSQQPANASVQPGQSAQICAAFGGTLPFTLHVQRWNGADWTTLADAPHNDHDPYCHPTGALTVADNGAQFRFVAENAGGPVATNAMTVTVTSPGISTTTLVSVELDGGEPDYFSGMPSISADGRLVAFTSQGLNLVAGGTNNGSENGHAYLRDLSAGTTTLINRTTANGVSSRGVANLKLSSDGRYALFTSFANDLVAGDTNNSLDVFRRDLQTGSTERVNVLPNGGQIEGAGNANYDARLAISGNGRYVAFMSDRDLTADGSMNDGYFLYCRDMLTGTTRYVGGTPATSPIGYVAISENGWFVAFTTNIVAPDNQTIWIYDTELDAVTAGYTYEQSPAPAGQRQGLSISNDGRFVAFALNSVALTGSTFDQVVVIDFENTAVPILASTGAGGAGDGNSAYPQISGDGRYVLFESQAPNLTEGLGLSWRRYAVVRDLVAGTTRIASHAPNGAPVELSQFGTHAISSDGSIVSFATAQVYAEPRP
jgi:Tol biopolymer transport system component